MLTVWILEAAKEAVNRLIDVVQMRRFGTHARNERTIEERAIHTDYDEQWI